MINYGHKYIKYKTKYNCLKKTNNYASYSDVKDVKYIGSFTVTGTIIAGETWTIVLDMLPGLYSAYISNHDLIIVHESNKNVINKEYLKDKIFEVVGDVGVDYGTFGFYDSIIKEQDNVIGGPTIPFYEIPEGKDYSLKTFGVQSNTGTGDGFFKCLVDKKMGIAILLSHE